MEQVRRGWSRDEEGWWWHHVSRGNGAHILKLKFTKGGEGELFGRPDKKSELWVADVIEHVTHMDIYFPERSSVPRLRECMEKLNKVIQTADNPAPSLEVLNLCGVDEIWPVLEAIKSMKLSTLQRLKLLFSSGEDGQVELLASVIEADCLPFLKHLELGGFCPWSREHISLANAMNSGRMLALQTLLLSWDKMKDDGWEAYANAISSGNLPSLKQIKLSGIRGIRGIEAIGRAIESGELKNLTELDLTNTQLDGDIETGHFILAEQMGSGRMRALERLILTETNVKDESCAAYANAIIMKELPSLSYIQFSVNDIGDKGAEALGCAIRSGELKNLAELDLSYNCISGEGMTLLMNSFQVGEASILPNIRAISLDKSAFTRHPSGVGCRSLAEVLKSGRLDSLEFLYLEGNAPQFEREDADALVSAFSINRHLTMKVVCRFEGALCLAIEQSRRRNLRVTEQLKKRDRRVEGISSGLRAAPVVPTAFGKIYLCGSPEVGKTTLRRTLQRSLWESVAMRETRPHVEKHSRGIDVSQFSSHSNKQGEIPITLLVWDMAGQEDYHVIHNAFFPDLGSLEGKATSFVVVCSSLNVEKDLKQQVHRSKNYKEDFKHQVDYWLQQLVYWLKFIASSCGKSTDRRHVFIVLNNFNGGLKVSKYNQFWEHGLEILKEDFKDYLNIETNAFIMDVRKYRLVQPLKSRLLEHSRSVLKDQMIPDICQSIQKNLSRWSETGEQFPVLRWTDFVDKVRQSSNEPCPVETLDSATKYLNEAGVVIHIDTAPSSERNAYHRNLVVLNPTWFCREIVGNMFLQQDMGLPTDTLFRMKVDKSTGSISESDFKQFFKLLLGSSKEWSDEDCGDLIAILVWLGLCYKGRGEKLFIPSLIAENITPWGHWESGKSREHGDDQWVMGFSVEHSKSKVTLAPIALWHRFQVDLAHNPKFNGHPDNDFVTGKYFMNFCADYMTVLIEVIVDKGSPTFSNISIFVKPLRKVEDLDGNRRKQYQVDLAGDLVDILLVLWIQVCPGVDYLHKVVWPWPASQSRGEVMSKKNLEVEKVKESVQKHGLGRSMQWMVGSSTIKEDQLLAAKDKKDLVKNYQEVVHDTLSMLRQFEREAVDEGICSATILAEGVRGEISTAALDETETANIPSSASDKLLLSELESLKTWMETRIVKPLDNIEDLVREGFKEVRKYERELLDKLEYTGEYFLQDRERICPRFIYLGEKDSGAWMTLKEALSLNKKTRLHFLCEAKFNDYRQHAVKDQQGLDLSELKDWAKNIAPWLRVSLAVMFISAKVAANLVLPGVGLILPNFNQWQQASSLSDGIAMATAFSKEELNQHILEGMGLDANDAHQSPRALNAKSRKAFSELLVKLSPGEHEKKLGLRKVRLSYDDGSHGVVWICRECFEKYASLKLVNELPI